MSDGQSENAQAGGISATGHVVRGGNREVNVTVDLVSIGPGDLAGRYEIEAVAKLMIPAGDPVPMFAAKGMAYTSVKVPSPAPAPVPPRVSGGAAVFAIHSHTVCRDREGNIKWEADTDPIALGVNDPTPPELVGANTVVVSGLNVENRSDGD